MSRKPSFHAGPSAPTVADRLLYGRRPLEEVLRHRPEIIEKIILAAGTDLGPALRALSKRPQTQTLSREELNEFLEEHGLHEVRHQGVLAILRPAPEITLEQLIEKSTPPTGRGLIVILDQISDPQNLGAVIRVCEAAGADGLVTTIRRSSGLTSVARKASAGASELLPIVSITNLQSTIRKLKESGFWVVGTALREDAKDLYEVDLPEPIALILGAEGHGLRELTIKESDILVSIPIEGAIQSLNVSQAAAVCLYELMRRRRKIK